MRDHGNAFLWYFPNGIAMANAMGVAPSTEFLLSFAPAQAAFDESVERTYLQSGNTGWSWLHQKAPSFLWALQEAGEAARPLPSRQTMATTLTVGDEWRTWAVFDGAADEAAPEGFVVRLRGRRDGEGAAQVRVVARDGRTVHEAPLPPFSWRPLPLDNPPDEPETAVVEVETGGAAGPYFLQARGEGVSLRPMLPLSDLPREVYRTDPDRRFGYWGGRPRLCFLVPEEGEGVEVRGISKGGYRISLEDTAGRVLAVQRGYDWSPGWVVSFEAGVLEPVRGQLAVFNAAREGGLGNVLTHGEDIPPFVALSPEAFFVPSPAEPTVAP